MANFIIGSEVKFAINLTAIGFSMDDDDFDLTVVTTRERITASKNSPSPDEKLIIFHEGTAEEGAWYAIIDTDGLSKGEIYVIATAHIVDSNASGGIRNELAKATLGTLVNP